MEATPLFYCYIVISMIMTLGKKRNKNAELKSQSVINDHPSVAGILQVDMHEVQSGFILVEFQ